MSPLFTGPTPEQRERQLERENRELWALLAAVAEKRGEPISLNLDRVALLADEDRRAAVLIDETYRTVTIKEDRA